MPDFAELDRLTKIAVYNYQLGVPALADVFEFEKELKKLADFDLSSLTDDSTRRVFWLNLYHLILQNLIVKTEVRKSVKEKPWMFFWYRVRIGGQQFSLNDIKHGILRANKGTLLLPQFWQGDARAQFCLQQTDHRIHFVISHATKSSPRFQLFTAKDIETKLDLAEYHFAKQNFQVDKFRKIVKASPVFDWYKDDFTGTYLNAPEYSDYEVELLPYDWELNFGTVPNLPL